MAARSSCCAWLLLSTAAAFPVHAQSVAESDGLEVSADQLADEAPIYITGSRIVTPNRQSASPVQTIRADDFLLTGVPNVEQTLNQLPQLVPGFTNTSNNPGTGAATLDLRGLGSVRTLILVNGRRWIANDAGEIPEIDVNTIPAALIDRVDIVTGGASAVYGSDAVSGVVNFVLKDRVEGIHLEARQNLTARGDASVTSADLTAGTKFAGGRGSIMASAGWLKQNAVTQGARSFTRFAATDGCVLAGSQDRFGLGIATGSQTCNAPGEEWGLIPSGSPTIPETRFQGAPPNGILVPTGVGNGLVRVGPVRFESGGDIVRFVPATDSYNFAPSNYLQVPLERFSVNVLGSYEFSSAFEPFVEFSFIKTRSPQQLAPVPAFIGTGADSVFPALINLDNPYLSPEARAALELSFGRDASGRRGFLGNPQSGFTINPAFTGDADGLVSPGLISTRLSGLGPRGVNNERDAWRVLVGFRGALSERWSYETYFSQSSVTHDASFTNSASAKRLQQALLARRDAGGNIVCIDPSNGCVPINIFGQQDISPSAAEFLSIDPFERTKVKEQIAEAAIRGDLLEFPAGTVKLVAGAGYRKTSYSRAPDDSFEEGDALGFFKSIGASGSTRVLELFGETMVPLLKDRPFAHDLTLEAGLRASDYDSVGLVWTWKIMGNWSPVPALRLRAGLQQAIRAPNVRELYEEATTNLSAPVDPCAPVTEFTLSPDLLAACARNGAAGLPLEFYETLVTTGGSSDLRAETARTTTIGAVFRPVPTLTLAVDYFDINIRDAIGRFGGGESSFGAIVGCIYGGADPDDPLCQAYSRGPTGFVSELRIPNANLARLRTRGIDWQAAYGFALGPGHMQLNLSGTYVISSTLRTNANLDAIECAGSFGNPCGRTIQGTANPRWKLYNRASWEVGPATFSLRHRYFSSTKDGRLAAFKVLEQPTPDFLPKNATKAQARHYFDAAATFDIQSKFHLTLGVNNLFDTKPSLVGNQQVQANTDPSLYDVLGRRLFAAISAKF